MRQSLRSRQRDAPKALRASMFLMHTRGGLTHLMCEVWGAEDRGSPHSPVCDSAMSLSPQALSLPSPQLVSFAFSGAKCPPRLQDSGLYSRPGRRSIRLKTNTFLSLHILPFDLKKKPQKLLPVCARLLLTTDSGRGWGGVQPLRDPVPWLLSVRLFHG